MGRSGEISQAMVFGLIAMTIALVAIVVMVERAQRRIVIQYPKGMSVGVRSLSMKNTYFPLKINPTGVMPPIFASALLMLPLTLLQFWQILKTVLTVGLKRLWFGWGVVISCI
ncbi:MAG: hypothetical protein J6P93_02445 [Alphaproteobacteria bacterium]|nr:hypothetical protein [Alphaproteobacteria bacterium]